MVYCPGVNAQNNSDCPDYKSNRTDKIFEKAIKAYNRYSFSESIGYLNDLTKIEPEYVDAWFLQGLIYIREGRMNLDAAKENFEQVIKLCPDYDIYTYYHLARIEYGERNYTQAYDYINKFLEDVDKIKSDTDYREAIGIQDYSRFYMDILSNPVPFDPHPVEGISTQSDEYLPIISPDNDMALFTRKVKIPARKDDITPRVEYKERFMYSLRSNGKFTSGELMPPPFNRHDNEGGASITIDNKQLIYTLCRYTEDMRYYNCDICISERVNGSWSEITGISSNVNREDTWESQPSITSDGKTLYFVSDRDGGYGGYDIYFSKKNENGEWSPAQNIGPKINTAGNEKSPFIHTDSQTLYFSSDGLMGMGGYDIFYSRLDTNGVWSDPKNIGYPINSYEDDLGFFVSTDGRLGYFASNKFDGYGGWDLYSFDLYQEARPEKVLFVKGKVLDPEKTGFKSTLIELKNIASKKVTDIPVDSITGEYVAAVPFRNDYLLTVKKKGYVSESKYISRIDPRYETPADLVVDIRPIEVGMSYRLNDIYFDFNSFELLPESKTVIEEFYHFLQENPTLIVSIQGHTDDIGSDEDNQILSENRAKAVLNYLIKLGISIDRLDYKGFGESVPVAPNATEDGRARNRRTEFVIIEK